MNVIGRNQYNITENQRDAVHNEFVGSLLQKHIEQSRALQNNVNCLTSSHMTLIAPNAETQKAKKDLFSLFAKSREKISMLSQTTRNINILTSLEKLTFDQKRDRLNIILISTLYMSSLKKALQEKEAALNDLYP